MSYDIGYYTKETWENEHDERKYIQVAPFEAEGGTVRAELVDGKLVPATIADCDTNITYNYSKFYVEHIDSESGIRWLNGKSGAEVKERLESAIRALGINRYTGPNWGINTHFTLGQLFENTREQNPLPISEDEHLANLKIKDWDSHPDKDRLASIGYLVDKGAYWKATPGNAGYALMRIMTWILQNPDGVFTVE
jgi:hypothetical protein